VAVGAERKGWGCCIDCIELRTCQPWEVSHGAVYLLREVTLAYPQYLFEPFRPEGEGTVLAALVQLLTVTTQACAAQAGAAVTAAPATHVPGVNMTSTALGAAQSGSAGGSSGESLLATALYEEIPAILAAARDSSPNSGWDEFAESVQLSKIVRCLEG
jgi:hypothetical protein